MTKISRTQEMVELPASFVPGPGFVICAKGKQAKAHSGNRMLRFLVESNLQDYSECPSKLERSFIVSQIIKSIRQNGGFVRSVNERWYDVSDRNAREKIGQMFRDSLSGMFKSSTKAKASIRRQRAASSFFSSSASLSNSSNSSVSSASQQSSMTPTGRVVVTTDPVPSFPIAEVEFTPELVTPDFSVKSEVKVNSMDFEPLPLSQAITVHFNMSCLSFDRDDEDSSFDQVINEMFLYDNMFSSS
jgi:hypothetical protein